ncbi:haloacid dehalogenase-like hydrolase [Candidatus Berkiella aquae]|uniref:Haloacid dehalogenase-like hydrolase n=1 Tax=Candidatus Berkiella aquae TaxID=295108 RepID=A0A0Q9YV52_9GAMM|nr:HAD family hydrolase [Candidatus Berkiella aquae]MCS5711296.1 haloacid dehalogenase-like hydrolase [Candidatus Berkiella aquae]
MRYKLNYLIFVFILFFASVSQATEPLPSWNDTQAKQRIIQFVKKVTDKNSADYVPPEERIAAFDNDGTLWAEKPVFFQIAFAFDRIKALAPEHPEWNNQQPFKAILENDHATLEKLGQKGILEILAVTHAGMTTTDFNNIVKEWIKTAKHPQKHVPYTDLVYQPMIELLEYLRANEFVTFIVSGGGVDFMRAWTEKSYGVPPQQVVGSSAKVKFEMKDGKPILMRLPEIFFIDDKTGKPEGIHRHIGRQPIMAFGNSDGDFEMLEWTTLRSDRPSLAMIVHHDDAEREWAYDRHDPLAKLDVALDAAKKNNWTVISMKNDWKTIFAKP